MLTTARSRRRRHRGGTRGAMKYQTPHSYVHTHNGNTCARGTSTALRVSVLPMVQVMYPR